MMKYSCLKYLLTPAGVALAFLFFGFAAPEAPAPSAGQKVFENSMMLTFILFGAVLLIIVFGILFFQLVGIVVNKSEDISKESWFIRMFAVFYGNATFWEGNYTEQAFAGHEYDGIIELDNNMPPWLAYIFYVSIGTAVLYLLNFHVFKTGDLQEVEYEKEMKEAALLYADRPQIKIELLKDASSLESGKALFLKNCASCHGAEGQGGVGPNFTDKYWIHGGKVDNIFNTIRKGVTEKGMIAWEGKLTDNEILQTASFILSLQGTTPPNPKAQEGKLEE